MFALRGGAAFEAFAHALAEDEPAPSRPLLVPDAQRPVGSGQPAAGLPATPTPGGERVADEGSA